MFKQAKRPSSFRNSYCESSFSPCCQNAVARLEQENRQLKQALKECRARVQQCEKERQQTQHKLKEQEAIFSAEKDALERTYTQLCDEHAQDLLRLKADIHDSSSINNFDMDPCRKAEEMYKQASSYSRRTTDTLLLSIKELVNAIDQELASLEEREPLPNNASAHPLSHPPPPPPPHRTNSQSRPVQQIRTCPQSTIVLPQPQRQPSTVMRRLSIQAVSPVLSISSGWHCSSSSSSSSSEASLEELPDSPRPSLEHWKISKRDI